MRVLICDDMFPAMIDTMRRLLPDDEVRICRQDQVLAEVKRTNVLIPAMATITREIIEAAPELQLIQQFGIGLEGVDIEVAKSRGIFVANVPGHEAPVHAQCTAEGGLFLMMACARRFKQSQQAISKGEWGRPDGVALIGQTALIVGLGAVGQALARSLLALKMKVMATDARPLEELAAEMGLSRLAGPDDLNDLLPFADFLISAVTLTPATRGMLGRSVFERMQPTAYVINISRGPIVNEEDLLMALDSGLIAGAGLDVLAQEPPAPGHPLLNHDHVVVTPHTAGITRQSFDALGRAVVENIERLKTGQPLKNTAN